MRPALHALLVGVGLFLALPGLAPGADYYLPDERLGIRTAPLLLLSRPDVRADLGLSPEQTASALHAIDDLYTRAEALRGKGNTSEVKRVRRMLDTAEQRWIEDNLSEAQQTRLVQLDLQWEGPSALARPVIADVLLLTPEQTEALSRAIEERRRQRAAGKNRPDDEHRLAVHALSLLTVDQRTRWRAMLGEPFTLTTAAQRAETTRR
jgi:hypothetical protein